MFSVEKEELKGWTVIGKGECKEVIQVLAATTIAGSFSAWVKLV
jgi:hypothetical protein